MPSASTAKPNACIGATIDALPDGAMIALGGDAFALRGEAAAALDAVRL